MMHSNMEELLRYSKTLHVLYVEDNEDARRFTMELLSRFFDHVTVAVDGNDGLQKFKEASFDLILTDINMPKMNGVEMITAIKEVDEAVPVLILSAHNETHFFVEFIMLGIDGYLLKPVNPGQFIHTLTKVVKKIHLQNEVTAYRKELETMNAQLEQKVKERTAALEYRLNHDALTDLRNRAAMVSDLSRSPGGIIFLIDIDDFQHFNDLYTLQAGNTILLAFTHLLKEFSHGKPYTPYRVYGDGFVLLRNDGEIDDEALQREMKQLLTKLENFSVYLDDIDENVDVDATVGLCMGEGNAFIKAEIALKHAKKQKKPFVIYTESIDSTQQHSDMLYWKGEIKKAVETDNIIPVFQGLANGEGEIVKYEALIRLVQYDEGERKLVSPFFFLDTAIKTKQYDRLTRIMVTKSFAFMQKHDVDFSINLSFEDISNPSLVEFLKEEIIRYGIGPRLTIEILESETVKNYELVTEVITALREYEIKVAIDDFGTGFSNFEHILMLNPDFIKIDGSLIKDIVGNTRSLTLVRAITEFSKELGIKVVAEFVSSKEIFETLRELSIDTYQGFYFSVPSETLLTSRDDSTR